jgi:hypothetical protein
VLCKEQAAQLRAIKSGIEAQGAHLVFIGSGATAFASHFQATFVPDCQVFTDPSAASYALLGAHSGVWNTLSPRSWPALLHALRGGFWQSHTQGHAFLQGGIAIMDSQGVIRWHYASQFAGDHPSPAQILAQLHRALPGSPPISNP